MNDGISPALCSLSYASVDDAVHMIMQLGPGTELVKVDISNAYRMVPVHPDDQALLGIAWQGCHMLTELFLLGFARPLKSLRPYRTSWPGFCIGMVLGASSTIWTIFCSSDVQEVGKH